MPKVFLAFANRKEDELPTLDHEYREIHRVLSNREVKGHFDIYQGKNMTREEMIEYLNKFKKNIIIFHYSGHADRDQLLLEDESTSSEGILAQLAEAPNLKLIVLNGCSTYEQAKKLAALKTAPVVVSTISKVGDHAATQFSIAFYQSLCNLFDSIERSFTAGVAAAKHIRPKIEGTRGLVKRKAKNGANDIWDISSNYEPAIEWKLPSQDIREAVKSNFKTNSILTNQLLEAFYNRLEENKQKELVRAGSEGDDAIKKELLKLIPLPVSEQLRKLFAVPGIKEFRGEKFLQEVGVARLTQIVYAAIALLETLLFVHLAQVWEEKVNNGLQIPTFLKEDIEHFLALSLSERRQYPLFNLIKMIVNFFKEKKVNNFFIELNDGFAEIETSTSFFDAVKFMNAKYEDCLKKIIGVEEAARLCEPAEAHLAEIYSKLSFITRYQMASIKAISYNRFRHEEIYNHTIHDLVQTFKETKDRIQPNEDALFTASVLILNQNGDKTLNLAPFIIDKNAFIPTSQLPNIYHFQHYSSESDACAYAHLFQPEPGQADLKIFTKTKKEEAIIEGGKAGLEYLKTKRKKKEEKKYDDFTVFKLQFDTFRTQVLS